MGAQASRLHIAQARYPRSKTAVAARLQATPMGAQASRLHIAQARYPRSKTAVAARLQATLNWFRAHE
ncbi:MAG: hypothetical protein GY803_06435 [Chloroflexi bacterium]|nr:hypothetical protein [Chloroflexota bacterium]